MERADEKLKAGVGLYPRLYSESRIVKGLFSLLILLLKETPGIDQAALVNQYVELGLQKNLSESRGNGFRALLERALSLVNAV